MRNRFNLNESEKNRIRGLHKINLISEQNTDFFEKSYVKPLADKGYVEVDTIDLPDGTQRRFLQDGDELTIKAWCEAEGATRIGFGSGSGVVLSAT